MVDNLYEHFNKISDEDWEKLIIQSISKQVINGIKFPKYTHISRLGSATAIDAVKEGFRFYKLCKPYMKEVMRNNSTYLDFGCGTGRIFRKFMRDFSRENMMGVDVIPELIEICKKDFEGYNFKLIPHRPPTNLETNSIDIITAYSVFSHFSVFQNIRWIREFSRIMRVGGFAFLTTYSKSFLNYLKTTEKLHSGWLQQKKVFQSIGEFEEFEELLDKGEMIYFPGSSRDYNPFDYGIAYLSPGFVVRLWGEYFELIDFIDDFQKLEQALIVLRKK